MIQIVEQSKLFYKIHIVWFNSIKISVMNNVFARIKIWLQSLV